MKRWKIAVFVCLMLLIASTAIGGHEKVKAKEKGSKENLYTQVELFSDAVSLIRTDYVDEVDSKKLIYGAMKGMLASLDDYSQFMEPDEFNEIKLETKGEFAGIGIEISMKDSILTIVTPIAGTPGEAAGLKPGDKIVKIDGAVTEKLMLNDAVKKLRGKAGSTVVLTIWRENEDKIFDVTIKRDTIKIHSIKKAAILEDGIGYVRIAEFQENTPRDLEAALVKLEGKKMDSLILDLRNNPGGLLDVAVYVAEKFLPKDTPIVSIKGRVEEQNAVFKSSGSFNHPPYPIVILVNEGSASASEIVAGALKDSRRATIMGRKTFGKASVQTVIPMKDGSALRLTTASYYTPSGLMIRDQGIAPDIIIDDGPASKKEEKADIFKKLEEKDKKEVKGKIIPDDEKVERDNYIDRAADLLKALKLYNTEKS